MLREITMQELADLIGQDTRIHILIEEDDLLEEEEEEELDLPFQDEDLDEDIEKDWKQKRASENEQRVLKAWNRGERTIKEIVEITGLSYPTVRKYIPESPAG